MKTLLKTLAAIAFVFSLCLPAWSQTGNIFPTPTPTQNSTIILDGCLNGSGQVVPINSGSCSAGGVPVAGFVPSASGARGTPLTVTTSDSSGSLPTGTDVVVTNAGAANPMFCNVNGIAATTADQLIAPQSWFKFTIPASQTTLHCIATGGSTTANMLGGVGLAVGAGGGGGSGGGSVNVSQFGGSNVQTGTGASGAGVPRVTVANDSVVGIGAGNATIGAVNQGTPGGSAWPVTSNSPTRAARNFPGCIVGTSAGQCLAGTTAVSYVQLQNNGTGNVACSWGGTASLTSPSTTPPVSFVLSPGQPAAWGVTTGGVPTGALNCIAANPSTPLYVEWN